MPDTSQAPATAPPATAPPATAAADLPTQDQTKAENDLFHAMGSAFEQRANCACNQSSRWRNCFVIAASSMACLPIVVLLFLNFFLKVDVTQLTLPAFTIWIFIAFPLFWLALHARRRAQIADVVLEDYRFKIIWANALAASRVKLDDSIKLGSVADKALHVLTASPVLLHNMPIFRRNNLPDVCHVEVSNLALTAKATFDEHSTNADKKKASA